MPNMGKTMIIRLKDFLRLSSDAISANPEMLLYRPHITCADGYSLSIQASEVHYSWPKRITPEYEAVELYELDEEAPREPALLPYLDGEGRYAVHAQVPVDILQMVLDKHGGIILTDELAAILGVDFSVDLSSNKE